MKRARVLAAFVLASTSQIATATELLPRVFFAPADRAAIVAVRRQAANGPGVASARAVESGPVPALQPATTTVAAVALRLDGISIAQDGQAFAWFNGQRHGNGSLLGASRLQITRDGVRLVGADGRSRLIRVGESPGSVP